MMRKVIISIAMGSMLISMAACKTVKGVGGDIQSVGQAGSDAIHKRR